LARKECGPDAGYFAPLSFVFHESGENGAKQGCDGGFCRKITFWIHVLDYSASVFVGFVAMGETTAKNVPVS
jgi:hypothetical protein